MSTAREDADRLMTEDRFAEAADRFTAALRERPGDAEILRRRAMAYFCDAQFDKALADIDQAVAAAPDDAENYGLRTFLHVAVDEAADPTDDLETLLRLAPDEAKTHVTLARHRIIHADLPGATEAADRALQLDPENYSALYFRSICVTWNNRDDEGMDGFKRIVEILEHHDGPLPYRPLLFYVSSLLCLGEAERSRNILDDAVRRFPKLPQFYLWRSVLNFHENKLDEMRTDLDRVDEISERHPFWDSSRFLGRAALLLRDDKLNLAEEQIDRVLQRMPNHWEALEMKLESAQNRYAEKKLGRRELKPNLELADRLCARYPKCYRFYLLRHWFHERLGNRKAADTDLDVVLCLLANRPSGLLHAATLLGRSDRMDIALELFERILGPDPDNVAALRERGCLWCQLGNFVLALDDFNRAVTLSESEVDADLLLWRSIALAETGSYDLFHASYHKAIADLTRAIELEPDNFELWGRRATVWLRIALKQWFGRTSFLKSLADYDEAIRRNPENAPNLFARGAVHFRLKDYEAAIADCSEAIRLNPEFVEALDLRARCYRKIGDEIKSNEDELAQARIDSARRRKTLSGDD